MLFPVLPFWSAASAQTQSASPDLAEFLANRGRLAYELSAPIAACVAKHDTDHPAFHGCVDWHSAVHGVWALTAYTWATGDRRYQPLIEATLKPALVAAEKRNLAADPRFEMPYGRAWFLRLAIDYRKAFGADTLDAFAGEVAESIMDHYSAVATNPLSIAYDSATWALINLYDYGIARNDSRIVEFVRDKVRAYYLGQSPCPLQAVEVDAAEFMAVCTNWAWLVQRILPREEFAAWLEHFLPPELAIDPIVRPAAVHQSGLNFSRGWGLWGLYRGTGQQRFLKLFLRHFNQTYSDRSLWNGHYRTVAHWVAQFGMLDLILTYYDMR